MHAILFVTHTETTFVLETSLENHFLWHLCAVEGRGRPIDVRGRPLGMSKIYTILLVAQKETTFVLKTSLENHLLWHLWAVKGKGRPIDVRGRPWRHPKYTPFNWSYE